MKTPITYYGAKRRMLRYILPNIPKHEVYVEPFGGSLCVLLAKEPVRNEVVNDSNAAIMNFFTVLTTSFEELKAKIEQTPYSRIVHKVALSMYEYPHFFSPVQRAWSFFVLSNQGFSGTLTSWGPYLKGKNALTWERKKDLITPQLRDRLKAVQMECTDAVKLVKSKNDPSAFIYADPPYFNSDCRAYQGSYTEEDFRTLLEALAEHKGRFLLSSYPSNVLDVFVHKYGWHQKAVVQRVTANGTKSRKYREKTELLTANYPLTEEQQTQAE